MVEFEQLQWVAFEGIDGAGKATQARLFSQFLNARGVINEYRHVFDTRAGRVLRELFVHSGELGDRMEILALAGACDQFIRHVVLKEPRLLKRRLLVTDRFFFAVEAAQGLAKHGDLALVHHLKSLILRDIRPDLHIFIDAPAEVCRERLNRKFKSGPESRGVEFHERIRENYLRILDTEKNVLKIDGDQNIAKVHSDIVHGVREWLLQKEPFESRC